MDDFERRMIEKYGDDPLTKEEEQFVRSKITGLFKGDESGPEIPNWHKQKLLEAFSS